MSRYFGVDFGTTNIAVSCFSVDDGTGNKRIIPYGERSLPFPSLVAINERDDTYIASTVKASMVDLQEKGYTVVKSVKTILGDSSLKIKIGKKEIKPAEAAYRLIEGIKQYIIKENSLGKNELNAATIAVPVDYTREQREELIWAFNAAGIEVNHLVSEPVAAYISNRARVSMYSNVMVFDWGGGTLDLSMLHIEKGKVNEIATVGWKVAGDKIDEEIAELVHQRLLLDGKLARNDAFAALTDTDKLNLLLECEQAKIAFSDGEIEYPIRLMNYCGTKMPMYTLTVDEFNEKIFHIVADAVNKIDETLKKANMAEIELNALIMVGGSSNIPLLRQIIASRFPNNRCDVIYPQKPQWSVADGAAEIERVGCGYSLNQDIGVVLGGVDKTYGGYYPILKKNTSIPGCSEKVAFGTLDSADTANFIFVDDKDNVLGRAFLESSGFIGERYYVEVIIGNTLVATAHIVGEESAKRKKQTCDLEFNQLSFCCDISRFDD